MKKVELHTDGAALNNPVGESGAGIVLKYGAITKEFSIPLGIGSNNRAELCAIIEGLKLLREPCEVYLFSDSQITINCVTGVNQASSNLDLWDIFKDASKGHTIIAKWNKKDSTPENKRCHELANQAARKGLK
jgi:ribonuclease HI